MKTIVGARDLSFSYGSGAIFRDISFHIDRGEFIALIGANGAGKSTLLRIILGELSPDSGGVSIMNTDARRFTDWPRIGYVPQNNRISDFPATAGELVLSSLYSRIGPLRPARRVHREAARHALGLVGMKDYERRLIGKMSGGQRQRVMLARVLASEPELMLLDEPTTGMDAQSAASFYELLAQLNKTLGLSILMVTHDVSRVAKYVSRAYCLEEGSIVELTAAQLAHEQAHRHRHPPNDAQPPCGCTEIE